ncbi:MBL fold metallo-hydrolase [Parvularcula sp. LCG005]|uniref:MBL fold metallo-hydrolase n=1 Tax=Parvularcula sp. LCG005 TaxID=3078805 RepID=UPI002941FDD2|nr:MBL fold metallo-hydrolase [Parvularcula sp. LCG005]WOI54798.1 MBL fold metallo-hydrolase [Parvularcula sp. LCG005]
MKLRAVILGCGSSQGVPRLGGADGAGDWGACDPTNPRNRRSRCSILVQRADDRLGWSADRFTTVLIDTSPDLRSQMLATEQAHVDAVFYSHDHADQCHGIDDLRVLALNSRQRIPVYIDELTSPNLMTRFAYCFQDNPKTGYPAILDARVMPTVGEWLDIEGPTGPIPLTSFLQQHGAVQSLGFRFGRRGGLVYSPDVNELDDTAFATVGQPEVWIVDALRYSSHVSHAHVDKAVDWINRSGATRGILTNMHVDIDYDAVMNSTPDHVTPAYDGRLIEVTAD